MRRFILITCLLIAWLVVACETTPPKAVVDPNRLVNDDWSIGFEPSTGLELRDARRGDVLATSTGIRLVTGEGRKTQELAFLRSQRVQDTLVLSCGESPSHAIKAVVNLDENGHVRVEVRDEVTLQSLVHEVSLAYTLRGLPNPDETWLPHRHDDAGQVAGDGSFHTPLAFVRQGDRAIACVPDWRLLAQERPIPQALEFDRVAGADRSVLRHGFVSHRVAPNPTGGFDRKGAAPTPTQGQLLRFAHEIRIWRNADRDSLAALLRNLWQSTERAPRPTVESFDRITERFFPGLAEEHWIDLSRRDTQAGTIRTGRASNTDELTGEDAWYEAAHSSLRTAYGMLLFGKRTNRRELIEKARRVLAHALTAPTRSGMHPSIFLVDPKSGESRWVYDSRTSGYANHFHALDGATTGYWMLRLAEHFPDQRAAVLAVCKRAARFMRLNQQRNGAVPSFYEEKFLAPRKSDLHTQSAETGGVARFLIEYGLTAGDPESIAAGRRAVDWIEAQERSGLFLDYETVAAGGSNHDARNGAPRQGTIGLIHCALAVLRLHHEHPEPGLSALAGRLLSHIARYQQIWQPPWLNGTAVGGMGAGNFDHRWNDARQSLAALAFFAGYDELRDSHWLERGVAALRAGIATGDREYRPALDRAGPSSSPHWGTGSACTAAEIVRGSLGQGIVDVSGGRAYGIDAISFENVEVDLVRSHAHLRVRTHETGVDTVRVRFHKLGEGRERLTVFADDQLLGTFDQQQLATGIDVPVQRVPWIDYQPVRVTNRRTGWSPHAIVKGSTPPVSAWLEVFIGNEPPLSLAMQFDPQRSLLQLSKPITLRQDLALSTRIRSRVGYRAAGQTYFLPAEGHETTSVSSFDRIDIGDRKSLALVRESGTRIRRFVDGREAGRHFPAGSRATYRIPVPPNATHLNFTIRLAGPVKIRAGEVPLHTDGTAITAVRNLAFELADHRLWAEGALDLTFEPAMADSGQTTDIARIEYYSRGQITSTVNLGETRIRREPDQRLSILVQPVALLDRPLRADRESLRLAFFGGEDYRLTPPPTPRRTAGSVASYLESISGGVTAISGQVLEVAQWGQLAADTLKPDFPIDRALVQAWSRMPPADVIIVVLGPGDLPADRTIRLGHRTVPLTFVSARSPGGGFLSCGAATTAVLKGTYGTQPLDRPEWGNFGALALSGSRTHYTPPGPVGFNLVKTGWADHLVVNQDALTGRVLSPLLPARLGYVLDCKVLPGRGRLFLEMRTPTDAEPGLDATGALLYWKFPERFRPTLRDLGQRTCRPSILRLSARHGRIETPHLSGSSHDLFQDATNDLPVATLTGERVWQLSNFRPLDSGRARIDLRYLVTDLLTSKTGRWSEPGSTETIVTQKFERYNQGVRIVLEPGERLQLTTPPDGDLRRVFARAQVIQGTVRLGIQASPPETEQPPALLTTLAKDTDAEWIQADLGAEHSLVLSLHNPGEEIATVEILRALVVPRAPPLHSIRPAGGSFERAIHMMDGVIYDRGLLLTPESNRTATVTVPIVLRSGPVALRVRCGLKRGAEGAAKLTVSLRNRDGSRRTTLLDQQEIKAPGGRRTDGLFLGLFEIPASDVDRVEYLELHWRGPADLYVVDLAIIRP